MEHWNVVPSRSKGVNYVLLNRTKTAIQIKENVADKFNVGEFLSMLEEVGFPLKLTEGLQLVQFTRLRKYFGDYCDGVIRVSIKGNRRMSTLGETFIHEVAHHIDFEEDFSEQLTSQREKKGKLIHTRARDNDAEYWARGFERYYSRNPEDRRELYKNHRKMYRMIHKLHKEFSRR